MGVNTHQDDYYESLFRRTTASFRAKHDKENVPKTASEHHKRGGATSKRASSQGRQQVLQQSNHLNYDTSTSDTSIERSRPTRKVANPLQKPEKTQSTTTTSMRSIVEEIVAQILQEKFSTSQTKKTQTELSSVESSVTFMDPTAMKAVVQDLVNKIIKDKLYGQSGSPQGSCAKPLKSIIEDIVNEKIKEHFFKLAQTPDQIGNGLANLNQELQQKLNISKERVHSANSSKTIDSQALMAELLASDEGKSMNNRPSSSAAAKQQSPKNPSQSSDGVSGIKRLHRSPGKLPEWQATDEKSQLPSTSGQKARSPTVSSSGRSSSRSHAAKGVGVLSKRSIRFRSYLAIILTYLYFLVPRSTSLGRARKPNKSDPVALYQYYKNEWDYFRKQIPGETNHSRLRWHVRQRFLDPE